MPLKVAFTACGSVIVVMGVAAILSKTQRIETI